MAAPDDPKSDELTLTPEQREHIDGLVEWMQKTLGINRESRLADNDWMFIVKLHAMIETGLNDALVKQFNAPELARVIAKLDTSNTATGKVAFSKALQILHPTSIVFIQKLSELRNFCVHDVRNFGFQLEKYVDGLSEEKRNELVKPVMRVVAPQFKESTSFREALYIGVMQVMMELQVHDLQCEVRDRKAEGQRLRAELFDMQQESNPKSE